MRQKPRHVAAALALVLTVGCATTPKVPVVGRSVTVVPQGDRPEVKGELLAVGPDRLWVQDLNDGIAEVRLPAVREVRVKRHGSGARRALTWALAGGLLTGGALAASCASADGESCGTVGLVVLGAWLLMGALAAPSMESSSRIELRHPTPDELRPFARLPQGLPEGLAPTALGRGAIESSEP
jgi:hypothetical protein